MANYVCMYEVCLAIKLCVNWIFLRFVDPRRLSYSVNRLCMVEHMAKLIL